MLDYFFARKIFIGEIKHSIHFGKKKSGWYKVCKINRTYFCGIHLYKKDNDSLEKQMIRITDFRTNESRISDTVDK